jgi:hypothetical protein
MVWLSLSFLVLCILLLFQNNTLNWNSHLSVMICGEIVQLCDDYCILYLLKTLEY